MNLAFSTLELDSCCEKERKLRFYLPVPVMAVATAVVVSSQ